MAARVIPDKIATIFNFLISFSIGIIIYLRSKMRECQEDSINIEHFRTNLQNVRTDSTAFTLLQGECITHTHMHAFHSYTLDHNMIQLSLSPPDPSVFNVTKKMCLAQTEIIDISLLIRIILFHK